MGLCSRRGWVAVFTLLSAAAPSASGSAPAPGRRLRPFGQALVGVSHTTSTFEAASLSASDTAWGGALGIGTDYRVARRWALRGQADYLMLHSGGGWDGDPSLSLGAACHFGR
jgi:hypothetical protein